jgi:uncharacterized protein DUF6600
MKRAAVLICMTVGLLLVSLTTRAQEVAPPNAATPPRLSLVEGQVSFLRPGAQDWAPARVNTALAASDSIYTGPSSNAEFQIGKRAYVRVGESTQLQITDLEPDYLQIKVTAGEASVDLRELLPGHTVEVDTPNAAFTIEHVGYYRFNVDQQSTTLITRRGGSATLAAANGQTMRASASEELVISGAEPATLQTYAAPDLDSWDRWNYSRTDALLDSMSVRYVPPDVYGAADLDHSGSWRTVPEYGPIWIPDAVPPGWAPYSAGHWLYDPVFGWTWVDDAPWGWAPYHYGRWVFLNGYWAWAPGPVVARPVYAPALVAWLGGVRISAGVGVGWVALGWGEPLVPWWGPRGFVGTPWWGGWGGPRIVNRTVVNATTVNVTNINVRNITYVNTQVHNAVIVTNSEQLGRGAREYARPSAEELRDWHPAEHGLEVRPTASNLVPGEGRGAHPPQEFGERSVVAMRAPHDPSPSLQAVGLAAPPERRELAPRVVSPRPAAVDALRSAPVAASAPEQHAGVSPPAIERSRPAPPPTFNDWRNRQQPAETRGPEAARSTPAAPLPASTAQPRGGQAAHSEPATNTVERRNLPGEPAMKLRPTHADNATPGRGRESGAAPCKEHECR